VRLQANAAKRSKKIRNGVYLMHGLLLHLPNVGGI